MMKKRAGILLRTGTALTGDGETKMNTNDILSAMCAQNNTLLQAFNPEVMAFRNKVIELQKNCPMVEWEHDMGATIPFCKLDRKFCNGQCVYKENSCPCDADRG